MKSESANNETGLTYFAQTANGRKVVFDTENSHAITHFSKNPQLRGYVEKIIPTITALEPILRITIDAGEIVGSSDLVETNDADEIIYALRPLRTQYSRFVKNKQSVPTTNITIDLREEASGDYTLYTAFVGSLTPSFPGGNYLPEQSRDFWSCHALVWNSQEVVLGTETKECPW